MITSGAAYALRALAVVSVVATVAAWLTVPQLVESAYEGTSWTYFNDLISGQDEHPLQEYLLLTIQLLTVFSVGTLAVSLFAVSLSTKRGWRVFRNGLSLIAPLSSLERNNTNVCSRNSHIWIGLVVVFGVALRFLAASRGYNFDIESYRIVADIMMKDGNVYAETARYNYGPIWFHVLRFLDTIPWISENALWSLRWKVTLFLTMVDLALSLVLMRWFGWRVALLFWLNPIAIIITGYHSQFDNLAVFLGLMAAKLLQDNQSSSVYRQILALAILGLSLVVKHILFFFPIWIAFKQDSAQKKALCVFIPFGIFGLSFLPYLGDGGVYGVAKNVLMYESFNNGPFWNGIAPTVVVDKVPLILVFLGALAILGLLYRKTPPLESALRYIVAVVVFSSAVANQYLAIPLAAIAANWNIMYALYSALGGIYLVVARDGLHWPVAAGSSGYDELILVLFLGLLLHTAPRGRLDQMMRMTKAGLALLKNEVVIQFRHCLPVHEPDKEEQ